jgi:hypothetical protein
VVVGEPGTCKVYTVTDTVTRGPRRTTFHYKKKTLIHCKKETLIYGATLNRRPHWLVCR